MMQRASGGGDREIEREMATAATAKESTLKIMEEAKISERQRTVEIEAMEKKGRSQQWR